MARSTSSMLSAAAGDDYEEPESDSEDSAEKYAPEGERKQCFIDMAKAIVAKDWEKAWEQYLECEELRGSGGAKG